MCIRFDVRSKKHTRNTSWSLWRVYPKYLDFRNTSTFQNISSFSKTAVDLDVFVLFKITYPTICYNTIGLCRLQNVKRLGFGSDGGSRSVHTDSVSGCRLQNPVTPHPMLLKKDIDGLNHQSSRHTSLVQSLMYRHAHAFKN